MTLEQLIERFRIDSNDRVTPYFCPDEDVAAWLNDAEEEAAIRARLLVEDSNPAMCELAIVAGQSEYTLHAKVYEIVHQTFQAVGGGRRAPLVVVTREMLNRVCPDWRDQPNGEPRWLIQSETKARLVPTPSSDGLVRLEVYRLPLKRMASETHKPEIHEANHLHLVQWALHKGYSIPDADFGDASRARTALEAFERHFGKRPDADMRRSTRADEVQSNVPYIF